MKVVKEGYKLLTAEVDNEYAFKFPFSQESSKIINCKFFVLYEKENTRSVHGMRLLKLNYTNVNTSARKTPASHYLEMPHLQQEMYLYIDKHMF